MWFGSVGKIKITNQPKSCRWIKNWHVYNIKKDNVLHFQFELIWFTVFLLNWFVFEQRTKNIFVLRNKKHRLDHYF